VEEMSSREVELPRKSVSDVSDAIVE